MGQVKLLNYYNELLNRERKKNNFSVRCFCVVCVGCVRVIVENIPIENLYNNSICPLLSVAALLFADFEPKYVSRT